ncbi:hypothetical protein GCM10010193_67540 [Kitasatospora atroaurantiaca]|uniref:Phytanoyl-CoA dioxygenase PhyH n=1 Tax=Kitasatospora atroaurantiaca TaxID=285545 RepID=A0A561EHW6_9ACTN|nr:phytanoyl-CoA dioxygenase family protein [Kitasatospora atroaurantiaca]TWE15201.1 phytanoyl-CoA dioxygenase PhyH [Kitasatospora atroaurantiaca]
MSEPGPLPISGDQRKRFDADGYLVLPRLLSLTVVERLRTDADALRDRLLAAMAASRDWDARVTWWRLSSGEPYLFKIKPVLGLAPSVETVAGGAELRAITTGLLGCPSEVMESKFMYKQRVEVAAGWATLPVLGEEVRKHTDAAYFTRRGYRRVISVAVCMDECTESAGALQVWPGTHRQDVEQGQTPHQGPVVTEHAAPDSAAVTLEVPAGSVVAWDSRLVHASAANTSGRPRRLLVLGYAPTSASRGDRP